MSEIWDIIVRTAANMVILGLGAHILASGADKLLEVPGISTGFIGGILIPLLGALPDTAIVFVSATGMTHEDLMISIGSMCGSTTMLVAFSLGIIIMVGRCDISYAHGKPHMIPGQCTTMNPLRSGIVPLPEVKQAAWICLAAIFLFYIPSIPGWSWVGPDAAIRQYPFFCLGAVLCAVALIAYFIYIWLDGRQRAHYAAQAEEKLRRQAFTQAFTKLQNEAAMMSSVTAESEISGLRYLRQFFNTEGYEPLTDGSMTETDSTSDASSVSVHIETEEAPAGVVTAQSEEVIRGLAAKASRGEIKTPEDFRSAFDAAIHADDDDDLTPKERRKRFWSNLLLSIFYIGFGFALVTIYSDPVVDCLDSLSVAIGIPHFATSFLLSPIASNALEFVSAVTFAMKKDPTNLSVSCSALLGAATINSCLVLGSFLVVLAFKGGVRWEFGAEALTLTITLTVICLILALKKVVTTLDSIFIFLMYPLSFGLVTLLKMWGLNK